MNQERILIGAVIPTFNRKESLRRCLGCLAMQTQPGASGPAWSLVPIAVVDGSKDGTLEMLAEEFPNVEVVHGDGNLWYTKSINEGIKRAQSLGCTHVLTLNDDITFKADYISIILGDQIASGKDSVIGSISLTSDEPHLLTFSGVERVSYLLKEYNYMPKFASLPEENVSGIKPSIVLSGRGILYPMEIFRRFGLYDERLVQYSSETDYTYNASTHGVKVMISYNAKVYENVKLTSAGAVYNNPSVKSLFKSLRNKYSINSIQKTRYYAVKYRGPIGGVLITGVRVLGILNNFVKIKIKNKA